MDRAIEELKKKQNNKASDSQDKALADLQKAKEKLEEILRQLREEERAMVLAALEARFRDMLQRQEAINLATLAIHTVPADKRTDRHRNRSVELARNEDEISLLAAKALTLLREEGSSVAFPEAVEQIRDDMLTVSRRLERVDVGERAQESFLHEVVGDFGIAGQRAGVAPQRRDRCLNALSKRAQALLRKETAPRRLMELKHRICRSYSSMAACQER